MKFLPLVLLAVAVAAGSCKKEEVDALPKATQTGQHTFGCLVDGKAFVPLPSRGINSSSRDPLEASVYHTDLLVSARGDGYVDFALRNAFQPGTYPLNDANANTNGYGMYQISAGPYFTTATHTGTVTLTRIDTVARIAAGTFQFTAFNQRNSQTVTVTEGRFDVRLK